MLKLMPLALGLLTLISIAPSAEAAMVNANQSAQQPKADLHAQLIIKIGGSPSYDREAEYHHRMELERERERERERAAARRRREYYSYRQYHRGASRDEYYGDRHGEYRGDRHEEYRGEYRGGREGTLPPAIMRR